MRAHRNKIGVGLLVVLALIVGTAIFVNQRWIDHNAEMRGGELPARADTGADQLASFMAGSLPQLARSVELEARTPGFGPEGLERAIGGAGQAWVLDRSGRVLFGTPEATGGPRPAERRAIASGESLVSDSAGDDRTGEGAIRIAVPVNRAPGVGGAVVHFPLDLARSFIASAIERIVDTPGSRAAVLNSNGAILAASEPDADLSALGPAVQSSRQGEIEHEGEVCLYAAAPVLGTPWSVAIITPRDELPAGGAPPWIGWTAIALFTLLGLAGIYLLVRVLRGAEQLEAANERLKQRTREAEHATRAKNEFISSMAHELRTPLAAIRMFTDLMRDDAEEPPTPTQARSLDDIAASTRHILDLLDDTMDIARVESGELALHPERISAVALAIGTVDGLNPLAAERGVDLTLEADGGIGEVFLDPSRLRQVLINLLTNSLKFTPRGGRVVVGLSRRGPSSFALSVEDTGIGIEPDRLGELFTSMKRVASPVHAQDTSRGLGLALTKRIVEAMGGHIGVESTPGEGSTFYVVLPRVNAERRAGVDPSSLFESSASTDPVPARDAADRRFSSLGIRSTAQPGQNFGLIETTHSGGSEGDDGVGPEAPGSEGVAPAE